MRTNTKLKNILATNTVGISFTESWEMTVIELSTRERTQFTGKTFSEVVTRAYSVCMKPVKKSGRAKLL